MGQWIALAIVVLGTARYAQPKSSPPRFDTNWTNLNDIARFHVEEIEYLLQTGYYDDASLELQQALFMLPDHPTLLSWAANLYTERGQYAMAEGYWARLSELFPTSTWVYAHWGGTLFRMARFDEAERILEQALQLDPSDLEARYQLACLYLAIRQPKRAQSLLQQLTLEDVEELAEYIQTDSQFLPAMLGFEPFNRLCRMILGQWNSNAAVETVKDESWEERMKRIAEDLPKARAALETQDWAQALKHLDSVIAAGLRAPEALRDQALSLNRLGEKKRSLETLKGLTRQFPNLAGVQALYGKLLVDKGLFREAIPALEKAMKQDPADTEAAFALICAYAAQRRYTDARDTARALPRPQKKLVARWLHEGHPYVELLKHRPGLMEWLISLADAPTAEQEAKE